MTEPDPHRVFQALLRSDFRAFAAKVAQTLNAEPFLLDWHHDALAYHLDCIRTGELSRLVINLPPRAAKSIYAIALCAFIHGHTPTKKIACLSYAADLAGKLTRDYRTVLNAPWYRALFPGTRISAEKNTEAEIVLTAGGYRLAWTTAGTITGRGADIVIIDDPIKAEEAFSETSRNKVNEAVDGTVLSRFDDKKTGAVVVIMQRFHPEDLSGHVLAKGGWTHLSLPAIAIEDQYVPIGPDRYHPRRAGDLLHPEREGLAEYDRMRIDMGAMRFSAQVQQSPVPPEGNLIKWAWMEFYDTLPPPEEGGHIVQSWDTASVPGESNSYNVCLTFRRIRDRHYLLHVLREQMIYPDLKRRIVSHAQEWKASTVLIEHAAAGAMLIPDLRRDGVGPDLIAIKAQGDKFMRMHDASTTIEARNLYLPRDAPWMGEFQTELLQFPHSAKNDQIDALSQYLNWAKANYAAWGDGPHNPNYDSVQVFVGGVRI
ncbi:MAG: phage terminase large subunit [Phycisphaerales bacterium]|nr:phage terminase large subunit [Hyphomonadaceae bacterium]